MFWLADYYLINVHMNSLIYKVRGVQKIKLLELIYNF